MTRATTSVSMCPASAISASELTAKPTRSSTTKYDPISPTATAIGQMRRCDAFVTSTCEWLWECDGAAECECECPMAPPIYARVRIYSKA